MSLEQNRNESRIDYKLTSPPLQNHSELLSGPKDALQFDFAPELHPSSGYQNIVTAMDVFSRNLFAYPTRNEYVKTIARVIIKIMIKHAYLMKTIIADKGSAVVSQVEKEVTDNLGTTLAHATTNNAQIMGLSETTHASLKKALVIETGEQWSIRHRYVNIAAFNCNTSQHVPHKHCL